MGCGTSRYMSTDYDTYQKGLRSKQLHCVSNKTPKTSFYADRMIFSDNNFVFKDTHISTLETIYETSPQIIDNNVILANKCYSLTNMPNNGDDAII